MKSGWLKKLSIFILLIFIGITSYLLYYFIGVYNEKRINEIILNNQNSINYSVKIKDDNNLISNNVTNKFKSEEIEFINLNYKYTDTFSEEVNGTFDYSIIGELKILDENKKVLAFKQVYRKDFKDNIIDKNTINISGSVQINYDNNNGYAKDVIKTNKYKNTTSILYYRVVINDKVIDEDNNNVLADSNTMEMVVPLVDEEITISKTDSSQLTTKLFTIKNNKNMYYYIVILAELGTAILLFIVIIINIIISSKRKKTKEEKELKKILKKYDDHIVTIKHLPNLEHYEILFVKRFNDLLDTSNLINSPINYVNLSEHYENVFIIFDNNKAYVYKIKGTNK